MIKEIIINEDSTVEVVQATEQEISNIMLARQQAEALKLEEENRNAEKAALKKALLDKLGITEEEARLLLGGN